MSSFTPGPWAFSRWDQFGDARFYVAQSKDAPYTPNYSDVATLVAETCSGELVGIQEANARLIAAAPDLLEALHKLAEAADDSDGAAYGTLSTRFVRDIARAAIARATGETA